jgi:hypothetical protein
MIHKVVQSIRSRFSQRLSNLRRIDWPPQKKLFYLNVFAIAVHSCSTMACFVVSLNDFNVFDITHVVLHRRSDGHIDKYNLVNFKMKVHLRWLVASFFAISAMCQWFALFCTTYRYFDRVGLSNHIQYATIANEMRGHEIPRLVHWLRFVEYSCSASVMLVGIALLTGITDVNELVCIFTLCAVTQLLGLLCELNMHTDQHYQAVLAHVAGWLTFVISYGTIASHYLTSIYTTTRQDQLVPWWVHLIIISMSIMFSMFGFVQVARILLPDLCTAYVAENLYVVMSLLTKTALGWMILGIALRPV